MADSRPTSLPPAMPLPATLRCTCPCTSTRRKPGSRLRVRRPRALERETHLERPLRGFKAATRGGAGQTCERGSWRDLARSRPGVATDRPTGRLRAGIAHNLVAARLGEAIPARSLPPSEAYPPEPLSLDLLVNLVGQPECGQRGALSMRRASVGVWATWEAREGLSTAASCGQPGCPARGNLALSAQLESH